MKNDRLDRIEKGIEDLFIGIKELKESQKKTDGLQQKTETELQKTDAQLQRTEIEWKKIHADLSKEIKNVAKMVKEVTGGLEKTDSQLSKEIENVAKMVEEVTGGLEKTDSQLSKEIKNVNKMVGEMTGGLGKFVEGLVEPRAIKLAKSLNIKISEIHRRVKGFYSLNGTEEEREADIIIVGERNNKKTALVVEAKTTFEPSDMSYFLNWYKRFFDFFKFYRDCEIIAAVAGGRFGGGVELNAQKEGLFVLAPSHGIIKVLNPRDFKPAILRYNGE